jgi:hypothetical protein
VHIIRRNSCLECIPLTISGLCVNIRSSIE